jgi:hypothetical protein
MLSTLPYSPVGKVTPFDIKVRTNRSVIPQQAHR